MADDETRPGPAAPSREASMALCERFLAAFNDIEARVRHDGPRKESFGTLSRAYLARRGLMQHADALTDFVELRNTLAHGRHYPSGLLATPAPEVVADIERLRDLIVAPPAALDVLPEHEVVSCSPDDQIDDVLEIVAEHGYSVIPVIERTHVVGAVTSHALARWLADAWSHRGAVESVPVRRVLAFARGGDTVVTLPTDATVTDVVAALGEEGHASAVVLSDEGSEPVAIATPADLPRLTSILALGA